MIDGNDSKKEGKNTFQIFWHLKFLGILAEEIVVIYNYYRKVTAILKTQACQVGRNILKLFDVAHQHFKAFL